MYQDLLEVGEDEKARMDFILDAINDHKGSTMYREAEIGKRYMDGENVTIGRYEKIIYDMMGRAHTDMYTANHKIKDQFFPMAVTQKTSYLLGNGVVFDKDHGKELGGDFDQRVMQAAEYASWGGVAFGFYDFDHVQVFSIREFVPLYDEETAALKAGIRFWQISDDRPLRATLYELDGYTDYIKRSGEDMEPLKEKRSYVQVKTESEVDGTEILDYRNYPFFPIVPLKNNEDSYNDLKGKRETLDALDLACSSMVNNVDEGNLIYWMIQNCGGMDELEDAAFIDRIRTTHVVHTATGEGTAEPKTIEAPFTGTKETIAMLEARAYRDFQCLDYGAISAGSNVATAIKAAYAPLDLKADRFEMQVTDFITGILKVAGIDDKPSYTRNQIINTLEATQTVLMGAQYYSEEYITKKLLTINGDADRFEEMMKEKIGEEMSRVSTTEEPEEPEEPEETEDEDGDIDN